MNDRYLLHLSRDFGVSFTHLDTQTTASKHFFSKDINIDADNIWSQWFTDKSQHKKFV